MEIILKKIDADRIRSELNYYDKRNLVLTLIIYYDEYLKSNYGRSLIAFVSKGKNIVTGYIRNSVLEEELLYKRKDLFYKHREIEVIDVNNNILNNNTVCSEIYNTKNKYLNIEKNIDDIYNRYDNIISKLYDGAIQKALLIRHTINEYERNEILKKEQKKLDKEINTLREMREKEIEKKIQAIKQKMLFEGNTFTLKYMTTSSGYRIDLIDNKLIINKQEKCIDYNTNLAEFIHNKLAVKGINFKDNIQTLMKNANYWGNMTDMDVLKYILLLNGDIKKSNKFEGFKAILPLSQLKYPITIDFDKLALDIKKAINLEITKATVPGVLKGYPNIKEFEYIGDNIFAIAEGDYLRIHADIYPIKFKDNTIMRDTIKADINKIYKSLYGSTAAGIIPIGGSYVPLNMYKVSNYRLAGGEIIIELKLKIQSYDIEVDALDNMKHPLDKR